MESELNQILKKSSLRFQSRFTPQTIALVITWLLSTGALLWMLSNGVRYSGGYLTERLWLQTAYVATMCWYLIRSGPSLARLPEVRPILLRNSVVGRWIPAVVIALLFYEVITNDSGILLLVVAAALIWILVVWRREIRMRLLVQGLVLSLVALLAGLPFRLNNYISEFIFTFMLVITPLMYIAGGILISRTELGASKLHSGRYLDGLKSFLKGCLIFIPLGLFNAVSGSFASGIGWVNKMWIPVTMPFYSGITEEIVFRLFLIGLIYFLLRPAFRKIPVLAVILTILFSAITFGMGHNGSFFEKFFITGLLFGLPLALNFSKRDVEHAIGGHYMINMIPTILAFMETLK